MMLYTAGVKKCVADVKKCAPLMTLYTADVKKCAPLVTQCQRLYDAMSQGDRLCVIFFVKLDSCLNQDLIVRTADSIDLFDFYDFSCFGV